MLLRSLSTVLAQDHFYSDFLSLLLTKKIHFESVRMIAFAQHSLSVLTFVKLMIECVVHLLSRFLCKSSIELNCGFKLCGGFGSGLLLKNLLAHRGAVMAPLPCPSHNPPFCSHSLNVRFCLKELCLDSVFLGHYKSAPGISHAFQVCRFPPV